MTTPVRRLADAHLRALAPLDPEAAAALGHTDVNLIPDLSPEAFAERAALARRTGRELPHTPADTPSDRALAAALGERLDSENALYEAGFTTTLLAPLATPVHQLRQVFDDLPSDPETITAHLRRVPEALSQYGRTLSSAQRAGHRVSRRQALLLAEQCESWVDPHGTDSYRNLVRSAAAGRPVPTAASRAAEEASEAMSGFARFLRTGLPGATTATGAGAALYAVTSSSFLGARTDPDELYAYGWAELARLGREAHDLAAGITGEATLGDALDVLDRDPARRIPAGEPLRDWLQTRLDALTDALDGPHFDLPPSLRRAEARLDSTGAGVMYYAPPDPASARPGRVWWTTPPGERYVSAWREVSTVHHEGLPGHHLQFAVTLGLEDLHPWQRSLCQVHGYAEGWAHYAEQLSAELGLLDDPAERLGMIYAQIWRAARIVIDIGLHLDLPVPAGNGVVPAGRWTPKTAAGFLHRAAGVHPATASFEVDRYLGWPGQALAFKAGARLWQQIRAQAQQRLGPAFDLKAFHMTALGLGPMGLDPLRRTLHDTFLTEARPPAPPGW
ncbi:DUF885 domain-containing protein [Streptomyces sp. SHP 1-2]|uniref:DUF885 domain-containing protein n=1 Tax=Streptomyces sp. SHP 1-2 TaxID=2769489 RepID=UPI00223876BD|nr:DUF885 domain-containing protein [Streptomyces sp. SHP 1-2]MCW5254504.1 DUF885 domain-containing protein [Streptomyces sp. SHP 1-2]